MATAASGVRALAGARAARGRRRGSLARRRCSPEPATEATAAPALPPCPRSVDEQVSQACAAVQAALADGVVRQSVTLDLPTPFANDLDDWNGGVRQQYLVLAPLVEQVLRSLDTSGVSQREIEDCDGIYELRNGGGCAVTLPSADVLGELRDMDKREGGGLMVLANPQWSSQGQVISDLGFGPWKRRNEEFIATFTPAYTLQRLRIKGEAVVLVRSYGGPWQVFSVPRGGGEAELVATAEERPEYWALEETLSKREGSMAAADWVTRAKAELEFNTESLKRGGGGGGQ